MPVRSLQNRSVAERYLSFQNLLSLAIRISEEGNEMSQDSVIVSHSNSTLYMMSCIHSYKRYITIFATAGNENRTGCSPD